MAQFSSQNVTQGSDLDLSGNGKPQNIMFDDVKDLRELVDFIEQDHDNDHVLCRRFRRLHLYTIYKYHMNLVKLADELEKFEENGMEYESQLPIKDIKDLFVLIEMSLKGLGKFS